VHRKRAGSIDPRLHAFERLVVTLARNNEIRTVGANPRHLRRRRHDRNEDLCRYAEFHCSESDRRAVIAAGSGNDAGLGNLAQQQVGERTARFERSGMLEQFEFEGEGNAGKTEVGAVGFDDRRAANVTGDGRGSRFDSAAVDRAEGRLRSGFWRNIGGHG
jgi:hypothetical protein